MITLGDWKSQAQKQLASSELFNDDIDLTLKFLIEARMNHSNSGIFTYNKAILTSAEQKQLNADLAELSSGYPLPYIIGEWSFYGLDFIITQDVLIPRPETELLVEEALKWLKKESPKTISAIYDIGTGSGIIPISIASHFQSCTITASDISPEALLICEKNIEQHGLMDVIRTIRTDGLPQDEEKIDLLCANLPYIPEKVVNELTVTQHEPRLALDGGEDGFRIIEKVISASVQRMNSTSLLLFEIESTQGHLAQSLAARYYPNSTIQIICDLAGKNRLLRIENQ